MLPVKLEIKIDWYCDTLGEISSIFRGKSNEAAFRLLTT